MYDTLGKHINLPQRSLGLIFRWPYLIYNMLIIGGYYLLVAQKLFSTHQNIIYVLLVISYNL